MPLFSSQRFERTPEGGAGSSTRVDLQTTRLLVGVDASPRASLVIAHAVELARRLHGRIRLLRALGLPPEMPEQVASGNVPDLAALLERTAEKDLLAYATQIPAEMMDGSKTRIGVPWQAICEEAIAYDADMIVIGSHGYTVLDRLLGTTAAKVVNHADRTVVVVRSPHPHDSRAMDTRS